MRKREFSYSDNNGPQKLSLLVPRGWDKEEMVVDSAGNKALFYSYDGKAVLYFAYGDTNKAYQRINRQLNIPKEHPAGGWMYKGLDSSGLFWREVRKGNFKSGYINIDPDVEIKFDTAVNHAVWKWGK